MAVRSGGSVEEGMAVRCGGVGGTAVRGWRDEGAVALREEIGGAVERCWELEGEGPGSLGDGARFLF